MKTTFWYNPPLSNEVPPPPQGATNSFIQVYYMSRVSQSSFFVVYCYINVFPCQNNDKQAADKNTFSICYLIHEWVLTQQKLENQLGLLLLLVTGVAYSKQDFHFAGNFLSDILHDETLLMSILTLSKKLETLSCHQAYKKSFTVKEESTSTPRLKID